MVVIDQYKSVVVFDLDDTLYKEVNFVYSAYEHLAKLFYPYLKKDIHAEMKKLFRENKSVLTK